MNARERKIRLDAAHMLALDAASGHTREETARALRAAAIAERKRGNRLAASLFKQMAQRIERGIV